MPLWICFPDVLLSPNGRGGSEAGCVGQEDGAGAIGALRRVDSDAIQYSLKYSCTVCMFTLHWYSPHPKRRGGEWHSTEMCQKDGRTLRNERDE